jgi:hypothetical protein
MRGLISLITPEFLNQKFVGLTVKQVLPALIVIMMVGGIFSPLFNLHHIHGLPTARLLAQHMYFESIAGIGGLYAASFCKHWGHRIFIMILVDLVSTAALVTLVG